MKKENELVTKNNKIKRAIWIFLASIGIASSVPNSAIASSNQEKNVEKDYTYDTENKKKDFFDSLKVEISKRNIDYKEMALDVVEEKDFNSFYEGGNELAKKQVGKLFDQIDKNTPRYASLHGIRDTKKYTNNYKRLTYEYINKWLKGLFFLKGKFNKNDPNWQKIGSANSGITYYDINTIIINLNKERNSGILAHEMAHAIQKHLYDSSIYLPNYTKVCQRLGEGMAADYGKRVENIDDYGTEYPVDYYIYNTTNFLSNGKFEEWKTGKINGNLYDVVFNPLDGKYGDGTGVKLYTLVANICKYGVQYGKCESLEKNKEKQSYIKTEIEKIRNDDKISEENKKKQIAKLNIYMECNKSYYTNLAKNGSKFKKEIVNKELKELSKFALSLIEKDINKISTLKDAQQALINWNLYKTTSMISKDNKKGYEVSTKKYISKAKEVQDLLFAKCKETELLNKNIDKEIFTAVLDANINDILDVTIVKQKNKLVVMDKYAINTLIEKPHNKSKESKIKEYNKNYTLKSVRNYSKEFAKNIKGKYIDFIDEEKLYGDFVK